MKSSAHHSHVYPYFCLPTSMAAGFRGTPFSFGILLLLCQLFPATAAFAQITVAVSPTAIPYGNRFVGTITASQVVTVTNPLTVPVQIKSIAVTGGPAPADYPIGIMCPLARPLAAGQSCSVNVRFRPTSMGTNSASLLVTDSASNSDPLP